MARKASLRCKKQYPDSPHLKNLTLRSTPKADTGNQQTPTQESKQDVLDTKKRALANFERNLLLIEERLSEYAMSTEVPLQFTREERDLKKKIADLKGEILLLEQT